MDMHNVAIVFAPCFMRSKQVEFSDIIGMQIMIKVTELILVHFIEVFPEENALHKLSNDDHRTGQDDKMSIKRTSSRLRRTNDLDHLRQSSSANGILYA